MKVVYASTGEQEKTLAHMTNYMYSSIFPRYFTDQEIGEFLDLKVLQARESEEEQLTTLPASLKAMTSLQVIISILELPTPPSSNDQAELFNKNVDILERSGLFFPFTYDQFKIRERTNIESALSIFAEPANTILM